MRSGVKLVINYGIMATRPHYGHGLMEIMLECGNLRRCELGGEDGGLFTLFLVLFKKEKPIQHVRGLLSLKLGRILRLPVSYLAFQWGPHRPPRYRLSTDKESWGGIFYPFTHHNLCFLRVSRRMVSRGVTNPCNHPRPTRKLCSVEEISVRRIL